MNMIIVTRFQTTLTNDIRCVVLGVKCSNFKGFACSGVRSNFSIVPSSCLYVLETTEEMHGDFTDGNMGCIHCHSQWACDGIVYSKRKSPLGTLQPTGLLQEDSCLPNGGLEKFASNYSRNPFLSRTL